MRSSVKGVRCTGSVDRVDVVCFVDKGREAMMDMHGIEMNCIFYCCYWRLADGGVRMGHVSSFAGDT